MPTSFETTKQDFLHFLRFEKRYSRHTLLAYKRDLEQFFQYLEQLYPISDIAEISHIHIRSWLAEQKEAGLQATSVNRKISSLSSFFQHLLKQGKIGKNPCKLLHSVKKPERIPSFLKTQETEQLFALSLTEDIENETLGSCTQHLILELLYNCGLRRGELVRLLKEDVEWSLGQLRVLGKGNKERLVPMSAVLMGQLRDYLDLRSRLGLDLSPQLLIRDNGEGLYDQYVYRAVKSYLSQVCTLHKKSPHVMRHTFATHMLNNGANIQAIKELLGHSSIAATQIYTHINIEELKKVHKLNHPKG